MLRIRSTTLFVLATLAAATASCGDAIRQSTSPMLVVVDSLQGVAGQLNGTGSPAGTLLSDVIELATAPDPCSTTNPCPTVFDDFASMTVHLAAKNPGVGPSTNNDVTITRYHVKYIRADGRNTQGVDVPYEFDGGVTGTVPSDGKSVVFGFEVVRHAAKKEAPLKQLSRNPTIINTIAEVTLYGTDLVGNAISATGSMSVEFGDFGDK